MSSYDWRGLDGLALRRQTIHEAWLHVHARRFDKKSDVGGPDSIYRGVQLAEAELRSMWAETGDRREIGSLSNKDAPGDAIDESFGHAQRECDQLRADNAKLRELLRTVREVGGSTVYGHLSVIRGLIDQSGLLDDGASHA